MSSLNRRSFLSGSAALVAAPAFAAVPTPGSVDVVVVGAGAAGIAAARRIAASGRRVAVIEASERIGGRCITDTTTFGVPFDRGAHWIHLPDRNPLARRARDGGFTLETAPPGLRMRIGRRNARDGELEDFLATEVRSMRAIRAAAGGKIDTSCEQALPRDLRDWRATIEFMLGPFGCGKELAEVSAADLAKADERDVDAFCRKGFGAILAATARELPILLSAPVKRIEWNRGIEVETDKGRFFARAIIVTASTNVLAAEGIKFAPALPKRQLDALSALSLGSYDHVMLELPGNPLKLTHDDLVFEQAHGTKTAALLANMSGTDLCMIDVGGQFGRDLAAQGEKAMVAFALDWLTGLYGSDMRKAVKRTAATNWNAAPYVQGAFSVAAPGRQPARRVLMEPLHERLYFAGEAAHETLWGTVGGAWESGERAADAALAHLGRAPEPRVSRRAPPERPARAPRTERAARPTGSSTDAYISDPGAKPYRW